MKLTDDYINPQRREKELRNKTKRRISFIKRSWKISAKWNEYLKINNHHILINENSKTYKFTVKIDDNWDKRHFDTPEQAKAAAFKGIEYYKDNGVW